MAIRRSATTLIAFTLASCLVLAAVPRAHAGAVFEVREDVAKSAADLKFKFDDVAAQPGGTIRRSGLNGAGAVFKTSAIPLAQFELNKCTAVAPHIHPNAAETIVVLEGKVLIHQVRGEEAGNVVLTTELSKGEAGYIEQGAFHTVENINGGVSRFLQIFDHPQGGAVFAAPSLVALPRRLVNSAFTDNVLRRDSSATKGVIIPIRGCHY